MTIAVTTPTGNVGSRVLRLLVQAGVRPRVLARDPARLTFRNIDVRQGDLLDAGFVADALKGVDALFWATPENFKAADPQAEMERMGANAAAAGVPRVVQISSIGAERRYGAGLIDGLATNEDQFASSGADLLTLRCGNYFTNLLGSVGSLRGGVLRTTMRPDHRMPWVDPRDVGEVAAVRLLSGDWSGHEVAAVHGPADLTWDEVAATIGAAAGRTITVEEITDDAMADGLRSEGMSEKAVAGVVGMPAGVRDNFRPEQLRDERSTTPTTLDAWAYENLRPLLKSDDY
jgi:uncharacterized protein YbjT (DUF2867 family)